MEFKSDDLGLRFTVPDRPTVAQQLAYTGGVFAYRDADVFWRNWLCATTLITAWECEAVPDYAKVYKTRKEGEVPDDDAIYIDEETNPTVASVIIYVGNNVALHVDRLEDIPKNS